MYKTILSRFFSSTYCRIRRYLRGKNLRNKFYLLVTYYTYNIIQSLNFYGLMTTPQLLRFQLWTMASSNVAGKFTMKSGQDGVPQ